MDTRTIELDTAHGPMPLYEARPESDARGAVIVVQEAFGVNSYIEDVTRRFADTGYHAVAPHLFHRAGGGTAPYDDFSKVIPLFEDLDDDGLLVDVDAALDAPSHLRLRRPRDRHRRVLLGRPRHVPRRAAPPARSRRRLLRWRDRHATLPAVPTAGRRGREAPDAVARAVRRPRTSRSRSRTSSSCATR